MKITELIKELEELKNYVGDVEVEVRNPAGDFDLVEEASYVNVSRKHGETQWHVYIES